MEGNRDETLARPLALIEGTCSVSIVLVRLGLNKSYWGCCVDDFRSTPKGINPWAAPCCRTRLGGLSADILTDGVGRTWRGTCAGGLSGGANASTGCAAGSRETAARQRRRDQKTLPVRLGQALERTKVKYDQYVAGEKKAPPVFNILIISGGGDRGAFGAGYLKGWQRIPAAILSRCRSST